MPRKIGKIREAGKVSRYHTHTILQSQNLADHSWGVAQIILHIYPECSKELLVYALDHDLGEGYTGDIPAPFKWDNPKLADELSSLEAQWVYEIGIELFTLTPYEKEVVKWADTMECLMFCWGEMYIGNRGVIEIFNNAVTLLKSKRPPSPEAKTLLDAWADPPNVL